MNYGSSLPADPATFEYRAKGRIIAMPMASAITVNNAEAYIAAARAGLGLIQVPAFDVRDLLKSGALAPYWSICAHLQCRSRSTTPKDATFRPASPSSATG